MRSKGDVEGAIAHLRTHLEEDPEDADAWYALGELLCESGKAEEGYAAFAEGRRHFRRIPASPADVPCGPGHKRPPRGVRFSDATGGAADSPSLLHRYVRILGRDVIREQVVDRVDDLRHRGPPGDGGDVALPLMPGPHAAAFHDGPHTVRWDVVFRTNVDEWHLPAVQLAEDPLRETAPEQGHAPLQFGDLVEEARRAVRRNPRPATGEHDGLRPRIL
ncbi:tetratricopeptide repeat protein [Methanomassiliicoccaceae archaeon COG_1]|nr:tetratricopeptide repeat protein [Methanomassiliicoccaceae archaeon COG_1]